MTSSDAVADGVRELDCGTDDYLTKPFSDEELAARLRALLPRELPTTPATITVGRPKIDEAIRTDLRPTVIPLARAKLAA